MIDHTFPGVLRQNMPPHVFPMLFTSFYTADTPYESDARLLIESLDAFGLEHRIEAVPRFPNWWMAVQAKARFIRDAIVRENRPLCWIDCDSIVLQRPGLLDLIDADVAAARHNAELLSGVAVFRPGQRTAATLSRWISLNDERPGVLEQANLDTAIAESGARFFELPPAYNFIVGLSQKLHPDVTPVILATRGSFRHRKAIDAVA